MFSLWRISGDEIFALIGSVVLGIVGWKNWLGGLFLLSSLSRKPATQFLGWLAPLVGGLALFFVLCKWSSHDVRDNPIYIFFYMAMGFGWAGLWNWILPYVGLSFRDDALELDNDAAGLAIAGSLLGTVFAFAGANIGDGPGWWVVVFCAALAGLTMILLWIIGSQISRVQEKDATVNIRVVEHLYRWSNWKITAKSDDFVKRDSQTIEFNVPVKPDKERTVTYTVHYSW